VNTNRYHKSVFKMERGLPPNKLVPYFRASVDEFRNLLPIIQVGDWGGEGGARGAHST
jgi:hypothetical protein